MATYMVKTPNTISISNSVELEAPFLKNNIFVVLAIECHEFSKIN